MIGVFDSGVGGLTVVRAVTELLPAESLLYLGDTARVPYGSKSAETVERYSLMATRFLLGEGVRMILVACNTASAFALDRLTGELPVPVLGAIEPGARAALAKTRSGRIGVLGTLGTIRSQAYPRAIERLAGRHVSVAAKACPLFVPLADEGWTDGPVVEAVARRYLGELRAEAPELDVIVLGCTHYPLLRDVITAVSRELFGHDIAVVDSAAAMAEATRTSLAERNQLAAGPGTLTTCVTDEARIDEVGARFLGRPLGEIRRVDL
jgi:glutamate racemase